jgi:hypothetical protein
MSLSMLHASVHAACSYSCCGEAWTWTCSRDMDISMDIGVQHGHGLDMDMDMDIDYYWTSVDSVELSF